VPFPWVCWIAAAAAPYQCIHTANTPLTCSLTPTALPHMHRGHHSADWKGRRHCCRVGCNDGTHKQC
jgi:hypothetical protein